MNIVKIMSGLLLAGVMFMAVPNVCGAMDGAGAPAVHVAANGSLIIDIPGVAQFFISDQERLILASNPNTDADRFNVKNLSERFISCFASVLCIKDQIVILKHMSGVSGAFASKFFVDRKDLLEAMISADFKVLKRILSVHGASPLVFMYDLVNVIEFFQNGDVAY